MNNPNNVTMSSSLKKYVCNTDLSGAYHKTTNAIAEFIIGIAILCIFAIPIAILFV